MISIDDLYIWAVELGITVTFGNLRKYNPGLLGKADAATITITIDNSLIKKRRKLKCVLAEEIGHILYPPRPGHVAYHSTNYYHIDHCDRSNIKAIVAQDERKALTWATGVLIPDVEFWRVNRNGVDTVYELAEYFEVEEWFMMLKIGYIRRAARNKGQKIKWKDIIKRY